MKIKKKLSLIAFICISFIANAQQKTYITGWQPGNDFST